MSRLESMKRRGGAGALTNGLDDPTRRAIEHLEAARVPETSSTATVVLGGSGGGPSVAQPATTPGSTSTVDPALLSRLEALEATTAATATLQEAMPAGTLVALSDGVAIKQTSDQVAQPVISGITLEAGGIGQAVMVGLAGKSHVLPLTFTPMTRMVLGSDGKPTTSFPSVGWCCPIGQSEGTHTFHLDPDICVFRA